MRLILLTLLTLGALTVAAASASAQQGDRVTTEIAESWLGHDASELLLQWPVDAGFETFEDPNTGETGYSWNFGAEAYSYDLDVGTEVAPGPMGLTQTTYIETVEVEAKRHCQVVFYANAEGIIHRYAYDGVKCRPHARSWGRPKR